MTTPWMDDRPAANGKAVMQNFADWFGGSKVTDSDGRPQVMYHGTTADFDEFRVSKDIGFHFGTLQQASEIFSRKRNGRTMIPVYLSIQHPLEMSADPRSWMPDYVATHAVPQGVLSAEQIAQVCQAHEDGLRIARYDESGIFIDDPKTWDERLYRQVNRVHREVLMPILKEKGYDGVVYKNRYEARREKAMSWVAFDAFQIKSALFNSGLFLKDSPSLTDRDAAVALAAAHEAKAAIPKRTRNHIEVAL